MSKTFLSIFVLTICSFFTPSINGQTQFVETEDFSNDCVNLRQINLSCGSNIISGNVSGEQLTGAIDVADYFSYNLPEDGFIQYIKVRSSNGSPSFRTFLALWGGQGCLGSVLYGNIEDPNREVYQEVRYNSTLTLRGIDASFDYAIELFVQCSDSCIPINCGSCQQWNPTICACEDAPTPVCNPTCEVYNAATCNCDPIAAPICNPTCEVYNASTCSCDPIAAPICNPTCEVYNASTCSCDPIAAPICNPTCEVYNAATCGCDPIAAPICNPTCEVYNAATCACDPIAAPICNPTCEVYNAATCACDPIAAPICNPTCEVYNAATCGCDPIAAPVCDPNCEIYNAATCGCDPKPLPTCPSICEVLEESSCSCVAIPNCGNDIPAETPITEEICDGLDNNGNGLIDENLNCSTCPVLTYRPSNPFCDCTAPAINNIVVSNVRACTPSNTQSLIDVTLYLDYAPANGRLNFSGDLNVKYDIPTNNTHKILELKDQVINSDGRTINFLVTYEGQKACYYVLRDGGLAPTACEQIDPKEPTPDPDMPIDTDNTNTENSADNQGGTQACTVQFISIDNINRCSDNGSRYKYSDDNFLANLTVHFENAPTDGVLQLGGATQKSVIVEYLNSNTSHTFQDVRLPADGKEFTISANFSDGDFCAYAQTIPALHITDNNPCKTCNILGTNVVNIRCDEDMVYFDLFVTGSEVGETYQLNGVTENYTGTYNQLSSFKAVKKDFLNLEIIDALNTGCTYELEVDLTACSSASDRTASTIEEEHLIIDEDRLLQFYPNPANEELVVSYQFSDQRTNKSIDLLVYDMVGVLKMKHAITNSSGQVVLDIQALENGIHLLVLNKGGLLSMHKFIKEDLK